MGDVEEREKDAGELAAFGAEALGDHRSGEGRTTEPDLTAYIHVLLRTPSPWQ